MRALAFLIICVLSAPAFAQIYYLPVQYQHTYGNETFYYGGRNPYLHSYGVREAAVETIRSNNGEFNHRYAKHAPVYSDLLPYRDLTDYGYSASDAANEANWNAPRYFRKIDLLRTAIPQTDGSWVVPASAQPVAEVVIPRPIFSATRPVPTTKKGEIIIIPKNLLDRPVKDFLPRAKPPVALAK
ncbi:MAG TPA: hypothetical protein VF669_10210 [Tepidisphaeraceae bacterium]|jgi:hypothetical protein